MQTLADKFRPKSLDDIVGQSHILGKGKVLRRLIENKNVSNLILFGPPGIGKTTIAQLVASASNKKLFKLNGTTASVKDIQEIAKTLDTLEGYMPENLKGRVYYTPGNNKYENAIKEYWEKIKK